MDIKVEFIREKICVHTQKGSCEYPLGGITCMIAAGEWDTLSNFLDIEKNFKRIEKYALEFLDNCFYSKEKLNKINGYILMSSNLELDRKKYTSNKIVSGRMFAGKMDMVVSDIYHINSPIDLINLEMMYSVINDMPINKCKNCNNYFVAGNSSAFYCDRIFKDGKSCKQFAGKKTFTDNLKKDEALLLYEKTYQATYYKAKVAKTAEEKERLSKRLNELKKYRLMYKRGEIKEKTFLEFVEDYGWEKKER